MGVFYIDIVIAYTKIRKDLQPRGGIDDFGIHLDTGHDYSCTCFPYDIIEFMLTHDLVVGINDFIIIREAIVGVPYQGTRNYYNSI